MAVSLREYRARIKSVESTKKITRAMELIARALDGDGTARTTSVEPVLVVRASTGPPSSPADRH